MLLNEMKDLQIFTIAIRTQSYINKDEIDCLRKTVLSFVEKTKSNGDSVEVQWLQSSDELRTSLTAVCTVTDFV